MPGSNCTESPGIKDFFYEAVKLQTVGQLLSSCDLCSMPFDTDTL